LLGVFKKSTPLLGYFKRKEGGETVALRMEA
jgi:hypothetical protein